MVRNSASKWPPRMLRIPMVRRFLVLLAVLGVLWSFTFVNISLVFNQSQTRSSHEVKAEIVQLSEEYIKALAKENGNIVDGPYAGRFTAFDLKKTIAVLLESMLARINRLEYFVNNVTNGSLFNDNSTLSAQFPPIWDAKKGPALSAQDLLQGKSEKCELSDEDKVHYPHCPQKIEWMQKMWKSDPCYQGYGVDGSDCSIIMYLSEVEDFCPRQAWSGSQNKTFVDTRVSYANFTLDLQPLMTILVDPNERQGYAWIRMRITRMWHRWTDAARNLMSKYDLQGRPKQKILIHLGLLSKQSGWKFAEMQFKGGPLGELVQWSDLISTLYILGHDLTITSEVEQLVEILNHVPAAKTPCQSRKELPVHLIYTDIMGLIQFKKRLKAGYAKFSCLFRVVDSFGTEPAFNHLTFAKQNKILSSWGGQDLIPQQFFTMFPHSPDNSFMGFVVDRVLNQSETNTEPKENIALVYGKNDYMWQGKKQYLDMIHSKLEVHGTVYAEPGQKLQNVPDYVINHGIMTGVDLHKLLQKAKVFVGLGFPYEGPAPLEAIANGAVFLNPKFDPPHSSKNHKFFKGKPTHREVASQHPYADTFIGEPYVYTLDVNNTNEVQAVLEKILNNNKFLSYLPNEYTEEGMLQRMNAYIQNQNFCSFQRGQVKWPPREALQYVLAEPGKSCKDSCWSINRICEPVYFSELNSYEALNNMTDCLSLAHSSNIYYPAFDTNSGVCTIQDEPLLFSCVGSMDSLRRLCPCRNYIPGQTALCIGCER
ncbi:alpha-1,6-mannosylglycoprotein 6-beta-N-acetylglucosaminyltransferase A-like [Physella acuta]|uniref:alpha-1,6-mannosylglycoprotein 6-beta-N-acetylglucosaminyltransferase A-like n=1 Tax=Physella acuta TaxID=109671 RepID=UPI0027DBE663|nr:alpha-1,6-mannosylglycoprotein 6-beta-N-acetylglucosaminyltransferase A-like [Physella acuta]